jgi:gas vesicle protein
MYQNEQPSSGGSGFALGILLGAVAGATLALLFAPKPGAQLRGELSESMGQWRDTASKKFRDVADRAGSQLNDLSATAGRVKNAVTSAGREAMDAASEASRGDGRSRM